MEIILKILLINFLSFPFSVSIGSEFAGKPWRSVARRDDARTGASSGYSRLTGGGGGGGAVGGTDNAFNGLCMTSSIIIYNYVMTICY